MSVVPMTNGMLGNRIAEVTVPNMETTGSRANIKDHPMRLQQQELPPKILQAPIDVSTRRNVLPCRGLGQIVLRREPVPATFGMRPPTGIARNESRGIAYLPEHPLDGKILGRTDNFDVTRLSTLGK